MAFRLSGGHESGLGMRAEPNRVGSGRNGDGGKPQNTGKLAVGGKAAWDFLRPVQ